MLDRKGPGNPTATAAGSPFKAIADPTRRAILDLLREGGLAVHEIAAEFPMSRPAISKHLRILRQAGLVAEERIGRLNRYRLDPAPLDRVAGWIAGHQGQGASPTAGRPAEEHGKVAPRRPKRTAATRPAVRRPGRSPANRAGGVVDPDWRQW